MESYSVLSPDLAALCRICHLTLQHTRQRPPLLSPSYGSDWGTGGLNRKIPRVDLGFEPSSWDSSNQAVKTLCHSTLLTRAAVGFPNYQITKALPGVPIRGLDLGDDLVLNTALKDLYPLSHRGLTMPPGGFCPVLQKGFRSVSKSTKFPELVNLSLYVYH